MIERYRFGSITIDGKKYSSDLKIVNGEVVEGWWRRSGHLVDVNDIEDIFHAKPDYLVIGTGRFGRMKLSKMLKQHLEDCGMNYIVEVTSVAIETYNKLHKDGKSVAAGFHLTC